MKFFEQARNLVHSMSIKATILEHSTLSLIIKTPDERATDKREIVGKLKLRSNFRSNF